MTLHLVVARVEGGAPQRPGMIEMRRSPSIVDFA